MSVLISASQLAKSFGAQTLFQGIAFSISAGQRIGLIGPNGAGKSTLLKILAGTETVDAGDVSRANSLRLAQVTQSPLFGAGETVLQAMSSHLEDEHDPDAIKRVHELLSRLELESVADQQVASLSGGWKKRVALGRALATDPNLLLLDEPTNHLDLPSILWLEAELERRRNLATLIITHDRLFLQNTCDWIFDLDRRNPDGLIKFDGTYADFLDFKDSTIEAQKTLESAQKNILRRETAWLRRGAKARQTKQKARIESAGRLAETVEELREKNRDRRVEFDFGDSGRQPKKIIDAKGISKSHGGKTLFKDFSFTLTARARVGLLGANGCGKSTLIRTLLGEEEPDSGSVTRADNLNVSYFEQMKDSLKPGVSLLRTLCPEGDYVIVQDKPVFAKSYLSRFHFRPDQMDLPIERLSGGEQSRVLLARLMLTKANVLVLDEPTNDLDIATLDTLQDALADFPGAVILVTHDRHFLDAATDRILAFDGQGQIESFADIFQWEPWYREQEERKRRESREAAQTATSTSSASGSSSSAPKGKKKLGYMEQREFDGMEEKILNTEAEAADLETQLADPSVSSDFSKLQQLTEQLRQKQAAVEALYARWQELSDKING